MFRFHRIAQYYGGSGKAHVHAPSDEDHADECLGPVCLQHRCRSDQDRCDCEGREGQCHDPSRVQNPEKKTRYDGGKRTRNGCGDEVGGREQRSAASDLLEELKAVVSPDSERCPSTCYTRDDEADINVDDV